ncbi:MAG: plasmid partitioning protein RepB C-terminal domain-containing protein [Planctomycetaceae bacterium]
MDKIPQIQPMDHRRYQQIPLDEIKVINSRNREQEQFAMNVQSIDLIGLLKPIRVNDKFYERTGYYELICGEGRLLAHRELKRETVPAEVVTCTRKEAYLESLVENLARSNPRIMEFARELKRLHDEGWSYHKISKRTGKDESYTRKYIRLVEQGEERLIQGVEQGTFPIRFATQVAASDDAELQNLLMDAFDEGIVTSQNFAQARRLIAARTKDHTQRKNSNTYTVKKLENDIADITKTKTSYVREAQKKENRFLTLLNVINQLWQDQEFLHLLKQEGLCDRPELAGNFHYET